MVRLTIRDFSCIRSAEIEMGNLTVMIGEQASGKSLISKLLMFFLDLPAEIIFPASEENSIEDWKDFIDYLFCESFPPRTWGKEAFFIKFEANDFSLTIAKGNKKENARKNLEVIVSNYVSEIYHQTYMLAKDLKKIEKADNGAQARLEYEAYVAVRRFITQKLRDDLGDGFVSRQLFIPAGRSFFTNLGKAINTFIESETIDKVTIAFGRAYLNARETAKVSRFGGNRLRGKITTRGDRIFKELFCGTLNFDEEVECVVTTDKRVIPVSLLSSGQQELYPLLLTLETFLRPRGLIRPSLKENPQLARSLVYIEESEAHLFPSAQSTLIEYFAEIVSNVDLRTSMFLTTHSPYVLAKINNLLRAGIIEQEYGEKVKDELDEVVRKKVRLAPGSVAAYAIQDKEVKSIIYDGAIDAAYLDSVTDDITEEFSRLLDLEIKYEN
ncbi:AAA family ATPase [Azospirillum sp. INR13]|uniref:AAA family ATPase n=1 Tax=Azospirillum sp. INR13 TaxID=2596919 RepID=UPI0018924165|nr:AAA family ATPase [Azospirillum sp. INR13]MBF5094409.1 AAA family ATPase [Azospirillum sp. INR13]